ncbi:MAG TPA: carboxymuconolactone decarboxylase family protein [Ktedonobacteraceae bacterium]|nr:carboxymuconolactone decarboxylase family protein [Ktedonobacteraceae bacterium]
MPRIPPDEHVQLFSEEAAGSSTMSTLFRVMNHRPAIMQHARELVEATMRDGTVDLKLKELLAIRVSQVNHCSY